MLVLKVDRWYLSKTAFHPSSGLPATRGAIMVFRDVTEQVAVRRMLCARAKAATDSSPTRFRSFIFTTDAKGCWDYCNQRWMTTRASPSSNP